MIAKDVALSSNPSQGIAVSTVLMEPYPARLFKKAMGVALRIQQSKNHPVTMLTAST